jgi:long-chain acyl-CoA synthetase
MDSIDAEAAKRARNLGYFFAESVRRAPDRIAIIDLAGGRERTSTYRALDDRMDRVARLLRGRGIEPGERVGMLVGNRTEFLEIFFGAMRAGVIPVPFNNRLGFETLKFIFEDSASVAAFVDSGANPRAVEIAEGAHLRERFLRDGAREGWRSYEDEMARGYPDFPAPDIDDRTQAFQPYTSGSTGRPKGAIMTHSGMLWYVRYNQRYWPASESDRGLIALPLFHKNAMRGQVKPMLFAGGSFVLMPGYEPRGYLEALAKYRCTFSRGVAAVFTMFLQHRDLLKTLDLSALRSLSIGSAVVSAELLEEVERVLPQVKVSESYGLTEGGSPFRAPIDGRPVPRGSVGVLTPEMRIRLTGENGEERQDQGELWINCPYVCLGYHNQPEVTRDKLKDGWLRTGDIFRRDENGFFYFRSRADDMFSCGGENIYPKEVENLLFGHPDVSDCVVVPVPHDVKGLAPAAMVVLRNGATATAETLKQHCLANGPAFAHPRRIELVDRLPLNGAGKIDRGQVRRILAVSGGGGTGNETR